MGFLVVDDKDSRTDFIGKVNSGMFMNDREEVAFQAPLELMERAWKPRGVLL